MSEGSEPAVPPLSLQDLHILVVEDETDTRELLTFILEQSGADVTAVASGAAALNALQQAILDLLLSDVGMSEMTGYDLMRQSRSLNPEQESDIPAIALTSLISRRLWQQGFSSTAQNPWNRKRW